MLVLGGGRAGPRTGPSSSSGSGAADVDTDAGAGVGSEVGGWVGSVVVDDDDVLTGGTPEAADEGSGRG